jgi:hypothetical protein
MQDNKQEEDKKGRDREQVGSLCVHREAIITRDKFGSHRDQVGSLCVHKEASSLGLTVCMRNRVRASVHHSQGIEV